MTRVDADGVFQGGGVKGLAIAGALLELAENEDLSVGRWVNVAGTSAGAIIAAYLVADRPARELADLLDKAPFEKFQDWGPPGDRVVGGGLNLIRRHGLARGEYFRKWFDQQLGGMTFGDVRAETDPDGDPPEHPYRLRMIAADTTSHRMLVLPDDLPRYRRLGEARPIDPDTFRVADAVRMSLSIPYFFEPVELVDVLTERTATIVDGGTLSNFPVWLFDTSRRDPVRPTFGLRLVGGRSVGSGLRMFVRMLGWPAELASDIAQTQSSAWDERFATVSTRVRTCPVDAGNVGTTDFDLPAAGRAALIHGGRRAAKAFIERFDLAEYRNTFGRPLSPGAAAVGGAGE
ncbi:MAG: patatin-like phospholipase family protein [Actinomycetota bacterium]|nr:patatin-like phospholipase family protein [Actinomycetota bacterium]